ncbi:unnamed protein product [Parnassius apollo]|uniref:(apollo) hypothetical protein n=1 Tax=Parnassius apollo TaxID=110799 RepID=A0A8S3XFF2_PARAO|nr:unnamed protein product [Parnassius apollo]
MGGAVSSGRNNNELIDNLMEGNYIRSPMVERVFRALDRADFMTPENRDQAYKDLAWRDGPLHLSSPCIYSEVMEGLELRPGLSFLNIGSGTGYLSTMVGLVLGSGGISHGVEINQTVVEYATTKNRQFIENSPTLDDFDYCEPKYYLGNGLCLAPLQAPYDRVYCGAGCPEEYTNYFKQLIRIGGILVMPLNDTLLQVKRVGDNEWVSRSMLNVSFVTLKLPTTDPPTELIKLDEQTPPRLQLLSRASVRRAMRLGVLRRNPELQEPPSGPRDPRPSRSLRHMRHCPRRICIPVDERPGRFDMLHDLDRENGANEMNALLSLVLSMGDNRVAGALRFDSPSESSADEGSQDEAQDEEQPQQNRDREPNFDANADEDAVDEASDRRVDVVFRSFLNIRRRNLSQNGNDTQGRSLTFEFLEAEPATSQEPGDNGAPPDPKQCTSTNSEVPADVEVYFDNNAELPGTSKTEMEWEESKTDGKREQTSDDDTESISKGTEEKRKKLDSGIGEENSPSSSSPEKTEKSDESEICEDSHPSDSHTEDTEAASGEGRHRSKRTRLLRPASSTDEDGSDDGLGSPHRRHKKRASQGGDARRVRLSILMKRAIKELPLPYALKKYVNYGRCFQF